MNSSDRLKRIREIVLWPEMRILWIILSALAIVFAANYFLISPRWASLLGLLLFGAASAATVAVYRSAKVDRATKIETGELRSILYGLGDAIVVYDQNFRVNFFNPSAEKLFGFTPGEIVGQELKPQDINDPDLRLLIQVAFPSLAPTVRARSAAGEYPQVVDLSFEEPHLELRVTTAPVSGEKGNLLGFMKIVQDRTREADIIKSKSEFLTVASHQLRTPVTEIKWAQESLLKEEGLSESGRAILESSIKSSGDLLKIVEDLLNIARIEEGRFGYNFAETDIVSFVGSELAKVAPIARKADVRIYFDKPKTAAPKVWADAEKLSLVLDNLLENAVRYNVENGEVTVKIDKVPNQPFVEISVKDTGIGISGEDLKKLFTKFFRAENALKLRTEGSGLGLYIARNIIRAHGGKIWAESEISRGSMFHFTLPTDERLAPKHELATE